MKALAPLMVAALLAGCTTAPSIDAARFLEPDLSVARAAIPADADPDLCWEKHVQPAVIESVRDDTVVQPAQARADGAIVAPPPAAPESQPRIVREREELWFERPCPEALTPEFVSALQRALAARGAYAGRVTGEMDAATRAAIRKYQAQQGLDSATLSSATARQMGLIVVSTPESPVPPEGPETVADTEKGAEPAAPLPDLSTGQGLY